MKNPLTILILGSPALGGSGMVAHATAKGLADAGHRVYFLSYALPYGERSKEVQYEVVDPISHPLFPTPLYETALAERIYEICTREKVDIIHAHYTQGFGHAAQYALDALPVHERPRLILTCHGTDIVGADGNGVIRSYTVALLKRADVVTTVSSDLAQRIQKSVPQIDVRVVPNFINEEIFTARKPLPSKGLRILHHSNFRAIKQPKRVVDIVHALKRPDATLTLIGDGPLYEETCAYARGLLGKDRVKAYGVQGERFIARELARTDVLLLPSLYESFSLAALEGSSTGVRILGSSTGGMREVVGAEYPALFVDPYKDARTWADALAQLLTLPKALTYRISERFTKEAVIASYERIYIECPHPELNQNRLVRSEMLYPLSYEGGQPLR